MPLFPFCHLLAVYHDHIYSGTQSVAIASVCAQKKPRRKRELPRGIFELLAMSTKRSISFNGNDMRRPKQVIFGIIIRNLFYLFRFFFFASVRESESLWIVTCCRHRPIVYAACRSVHTAHCSTRNNVFTSNYGNRICIYKTTENMVMKTSNVEQNEKNE